MRCLLLVLLMSCTAASSAQWGYRAAPQPPHPAVVRIKVPEVDGIAYGSGTLVDVREDYGLVLTNWHVVHAASGPIEVTFPSGFVSQARSLKMDSDWDLAALVIWKPSCEPVRLAAHPPQPGDILTICGYGSGDYRAATGRCTQYYAPRLHLPQELVELDVQARQGDSGGPIFNARGELAGVLFGAGQGTTLGSFEGRVKTFLASLGPNVGQHDGAPQVAMKPASQPCTTCQTCPTCPNCPQGVVCENGVCRPQNDLGSVAFGCGNVSGREEKSGKYDDEWPDVGKLANAPVSWSSGEKASSGSAPASAWSGSNAAQPVVAASSGSPSFSLLGENLFDNVRNALAVAGVIAIAMQVLRFVR
jgi:hypothetical protein